MKLCIGGAYQGQAELAERENPGASIWADFHETVREAVLNGDRDPGAFARDFIREHPDAVVVSDEVGAGVVPVSARDRAYREAVGRVLCLIAREAEQVTRCVCGIGVRIK